MGNTKKLYIIISNSAFFRSLRYTFNSELIAKLEAAAKSGKMEKWPDNQLIDCTHGFHYQTLTVPAECTAESLGIDQPQYYARMLPDDYADRFLEVDEGDKK